MPESAPKPIFLSYASQDADAARRICDALRAAGLEVWFDQSELRGGEAWDAAIRRQIRECALFVPMISANTNARSEGYFRLEWKLAIDRSHLMADDQPFLMPVMIDDTPESAARVPDRFRERQWRRLNDEAAIADFARRVKQLLSADAAPRMAVTEQASLANVYVSTETKTRGETFDVGNKQSGIASPPFRFRLWHAWWVLPLLAALGVFAYFLPSWVPQAARLGLKSAATVDRGSIAVLPLKPLAAANAQDLLGLGLADAIISQLSKSRQITVRPLTAVRGYTALDTDAAAAAKALAVAAVLDGTWQQAGDRLRVNASLIRAADRKVLWSATFDVKATDIFGLQDQVSQAVAAHLRIVLDQELNSKRPSSISPHAYEAHAKGVQSFYKNLNSSPDTSEAVNYFQQALAEAPDFALAHARLAYAFLWNAIFDKRQAGLYEKALVELHRADQLDPNLPLLHMIRGAISNSEYGQWQLATAYREFRTAERLDPTQVDFELAALFFHVGLEDQAQREVFRLLALNPENVSAKELYVGALLAFARPDEASKAAKELLNTGPSVSFYLEKRMISTAAERLDKFLAEHPEMKDKLESKALLLALQGRHAEARAMIRKIVAQSTSGRARHHETYAAARIHALGGDAKEAVHWLQITADTGMPNLPLFKRDPMLAQIRESAEFKAFIAALEPRWQTLVAEIQ